MKKKLPDEPVDWLKYWTDQKAERGHAAMFSRRDANDKAVVERATVNEWARSLVMLEGRHVSEVAHGPSNAFPDFTGTLEGVPVSIELTELLYSKCVVGRAKRRELTYKQVQWSECHFRARVDERLNDKANKRAVRGGSIDFLVVHTDEPWLSPQEVEGWLAQKCFDREAKSKKLTC